VGRHNATSGTLEIQTRKSAIKGQAEEEATMGRRAQCNADPNRKKHHQAMSRGRSHGDEGSSAIDIRNKQGAINITILKWKATRENI
jgi:hypothetical protein